MFSFSLLSIIIYEEIFVFKFQNYPRTFNSFKTLLCIYKNIFSLFLSCFYRSYFSSSFKKRIMSALLKNPVFYSKNIGMVSSLVNYLNFIAVNEWWRILKSLKFVDLGNKVHKLFVLIA